MIVDAMKDRAPRSVVCQRHAIRPHVAAPDGNGRIAVRPSWENLMTSKNRQRGFSLLELLITVSIGFTFAAITFIAMMPLFNKSHVDSAYETTLAALRNTRNLAISQSHEYIVTFNPSAPGPPIVPATIQVTYQPPAGTNGAAAGVLPPVQLVGTYSLPTDINFATMSGFPSNAPDNLGSGATAIDFGYGPNQTTGQPQIVFMPDGGSYDANGDYNSGVLYLSRTTDTIYSSRAISIFGATGRVRGWRLYKQSGNPIWVQQ
jgi:prepilin-type N-terminal cleavage/methylation domain-containing protein